MRKGENIYYRKDGRWEGRYIKGKKADGKTKYGSVYGKTFQEVRRKLYPLKAKYQEIRETQGETSMSFHEWGIRWLNEVKAEIKQSTYANYEYKLEHYVFYEIGEYSLNELDESVAQLLVQRLNRRKLKSSTIQAIFRIINQTMNQAIRQKRITDNPFLAIRFPKMPKKKKQALTKIEQKRLEKTALAEKKGRGIPILLALHAGLRIGEISALKWEDVDFETNQIHVNSTYQRVIDSTNREEKTTLIYTRSKTESSVRTIPISQTLRKTLLQYKKRATGAFICSRKDEPSEPRLLTYHFHRLREKAGLATIHFHQLRHTFATRCVESNGDIVSISALMGHSSSKMTLDTYADAMMEQRVQVVHQMEKAIS
ncbi:tyrosine-type recombinase/integrase [Enterococcus gilvus]|uniref:tyrosine-type recombinase/integrase n=1 Tax=Enterococcus gilvus TaxID=160453 RepID=UPI00345E073F